MVSRGGIGHHRRSNERDGNCDGHRTDGVLSTEPWTARSSTGMKIKT